MSNSPDLVRQYITEIGRVPLLNRQQEIDLGQQIQKWVQLKKILTQAIESGALILKQDDEEGKHRWAQLAQLKVSELEMIETAGKRAKDQMLKANLHLVVTIAKKYQRRGVEFLDLIQEGNLGLEQAVEKFDPTKGYKFSTYAYWWIRQAITRAIAQQARTIRLPIHI